MKMPNKMNKIDKRKLALTALRGTVAATGLFSSLFAAPFTPDFQAPKGKYSKEKLLFLDLNQTPILTVSCDECKPVKHSYCHGSTTTSVNGGDDDAHSWICDDY